MSYIKGNQLWKLRTKHGKEPKYKPEQLWEKALEYFQWIEDNPLQEEQLFAYQGKVIKEIVNKMHAMTFEGLQIFLDISQPTWDSYKKKNDYLIVTTRIEKIIKEQKFTGAAGNLLNANIIARDLGLRDDQNIDSSVNITVTHLKKPPINER